jgi:hypothetical protein
MNPLPLPLIEMCHGRSEWIVDKETSEGVNCRQYLGLQRNPAMVMAGKSHNSSLKEHPSRSGIVRQGGIFQDGISQRRDSAALYNKQLDVDASQRVPQLVYFWFLRHQMVIGGTVSGNR